MSKLKLLPDEAFGEGSPTKLDGLGFDAYAEVLAGAVRNTDGPFTVGVFGEWGMGKTSLMRLIEKKVENAPQTLVVWFNAWRYEKEEHPIVPLIATIICKLNEEQSVGKKSRGHAERLVAALRSIAYGFSAKSKVKVPGMAEIEASFVAKDMIEREDALARDALLDRSLYYNAFERLTKATAKTDIRIIIFVDDLDRCMPDRAVSLLESIKLVLWQRNFVFVLGVARTVIEGYLNHRYRREYGLEGFQGHSYLDKIVQLPFYIPDHEDRMPAFCDYLIKSLELEDSSSFDEILPILCVACVGNPRAITRFVNNLLIDRDICRILAEKDQQFTSISIGLFAITRALQQRWHDVFVLLATSDRLCQHAADLLHAEPAESGPGPTDSDFKDLAERISSDRELKQVLSSKASEQWLRNHRLRNATRDFLSSRRRQTEGPSEYKVDACFNYSIADKEVVRRVARVLIGEGIKLYFDELGECASLKSVMPRVVVAVVSIHSQASESFGRELDGAINGDRIKVITVLLPGVEREAIRPEVLRQTICIEIQSTGITQESLLPLTRAVLHARGSF